jgi:hypothetical protein
MNYECTPTSRAISYRGSEFHEVPSPYAVITWGLVSCDPDKGFSSGSKNVMKATQCLGHVACQVSSRQNQKISERG